MRTGNILFIVLLVLLGTYTNNNRMFAQVPQSSGPNAQVGLILYPVIHDPNGQQYIITKAGYRIAIPGAGIDHNAQQIAVYRDAENNYWYIDKNNNPTPVSPEQMQRVMAQIQGQVEYRTAMQQQSQYSSPTQTLQGQSANQNQQQSNSSTSQQQNSKSGSSALVTGLAAAGGAAVGSILTNSIYDNNNEYPGYNGIPYGAPLYREEAGRYYYNTPEGKRIYVAPNSNTSALFNQYDQQGAWKNRDQWAQNNNLNTASSTENQSGRLSRRERRKEAKEAQKDSLQSVNQAQQDNSGEGRRGLRRGRLLER